MRAPEDLTVLIVDDNDYGRILLSTSLEKLGIGRAVGVPDALEAIAFLTKEKADIALVDWYMPEINGAGFIRLMRQLGHDVPVVICTAYATSENVKRIRGLGLQHVLVKPHDDNALLRTIWAALRDHDTAAGPANVPLAASEEDDEDQVFL